jgi:transposase
VPAERLVFLDESAARTDMARLYARAPRGERAVGTVPHGHWKSTTLLGAVRLGGPSAAVTVDGAVDADTFEVYAREVPAPALAPGDVVVMDNPAAHKRPAVREAIEAAGAAALYLPPYSPDYNPIENMWSKVKAFLRAAAARTFDALSAAVDAALATVTPQDCRGFYRHCGYPAT